VIAEQEEPVMDATSDQSNLSTARKRILVVDDNADSAKALARLLKLHGHEGYPVFDGSSALEAALDLRPDAVLLDLSLPDMSGEEVAAGIRASSVLQDTTIIAVSGYPLEYHGQNLFDGHAMKPVDVEHILALLAMAQNARQPRVTADPA
jgi:CheY-like chemotaxis protein